MQLDEVGSCMHRAGREERGGEGGGGGGRRGGEGGGGERGEWKKGVGRYGEM